MIRSALQAWPPRRRLALIAVLPVVATWFVFVGRTAAVGPPGTGWYVAVAMASLLGAAVLAGYLPVAGGGLDLGCTPCATLSALSLVGATMALRSYGTDLAGPLIAVAVLLFGLSQRLNQPTTCATPVRDGS